MYQTLNLGKDGSFEMREMQILDVLVKMELATTRLALAHGQI